MEFFNRAKKIVRKAPPDLKRRLIIIVAFLFILSVSVWAAILFFAHSSPLIIGLSFLAYGLGLRHAIDADHIAAIDNTTRKLMQEGKQPIAVGLFFSLGHSTIVILLSIIVALSATSVHNALPTLKESGSLIGTGISSIFLIIIGVANLIIFIDIFKVWRLVVKGKKYKEQAITQHLHKRGFFARFFRPLFKRIKNSHDMYLIGLLFGLGFDTASEIGLLTLSAVSITNGIPIIGVLLLPLAFTAAMALIDTLDGILMLGAYGWAYIKPVRKLYYNMNITLISVVIALCIGSIEGLQVIIEKTKLSGGIFDLIGKIDLGNVGFFIIVAFLASWVLSIILYKIRGYDRLS